MGLVGGIDRHQHRPDFRCGKHEGQPVGHVARPDAHVVTRLDADRQQPPRQIIYAPVELAIGPAQSAVWIHHKILLRVLGYLLLKESVYSFGRIQHTAACPAYMGV